MDVYPSAVSKSINSKSWGLNIHFQESQTLHTECTLEKSSKFFLQSPAKNRLQFSQN